jgi:beta-glucosidase-like glycosyl hydrolase
MQSAAPYQFDLEMARLDAKRPAVSTKTTGSSPKDSLEIDQDATDTTRLLTKGDEDEAHRQEIRFRRKSRETTPQSRKSCLKWTGFIGAGLFGGLAALGFYLYKHEATYGQSPPWYPAPPGGTLEPWQDSYEKARTMVDKMSLLEKVNITTGVGWASDFCVGNTAPAPEAGFPGLCLQDGPLGLRFADHVSAFAAGLTVGATFNKDLMYRRGRALGQEARRKGVNVLLGPAMGPLGKFPAGGRNWEGFGSDPVLQGIASFETIRGTQDEGVIATAKHFIGNEQEHFRQGLEWGIPNSLSSNIDDRTLHELYAWPFADSVRAGVGSIMCSYNMVNNSYACANSKLMNGILKDELGFQGFVQSDWLAQRSGVASALAGLDMTMPGDGQFWANGKSFWGDKLTVAVLNGSIPVERLNDMAARVVATWYQLGQDDKKKFPLDGPSFSSWTNNEVDKIHWSSGENVTGVVNKFDDVQGSGNKEFHGRLAKYLGTEGTVVVKNEDNTLPLTREGWPEGKTVRSEGRKFRVGVFGEDAGPGSKGANGCPNRACNDGTLVMGWGSGTAELPYLITPLEALQASFHFNEVDLQAYLTNKPDIARNASIAAEQDLCLIFASANSGEGYVSVDGIRGDRNDLYLQKSGDKLIQDVASRCGGPSVVIVHAAGPVIMERWIDIPGVKATLLAHLPGEESGNALASVLFGFADASGRLPYTVGKSLEDYGPRAQIMYYPNGVVPQQDFDDGLFIDYRHFDRAAIEPRYEFGYGQSFATFSFSDFHIEELRPKSPLPLPRPQGLPSPSYASKPLPDPSSATFPAGFHRVPKRIYPYLESADSVQNGSYPYPEGYSDQQPLSPAGGGLGGNPSLYEDHLRVTLAVTNTGKRRGKAVVQLYVSFPDGTKDIAGEDVEFPVRVLRQFEKVEVLIGKTEKVEMHLNRKDLSYWCIRRQNWVMPDGEFRISVGVSSRRMEWEGKW